MPSAALPGVVFHYRPAGERYALTFPAARRTCLDNSAIIASPQHLQAAFEDGYDNCDAGWLADQTVRWVCGMGCRPGTAQRGAESPRAPLRRYPITLSRPGCYGDRNSLPGVRSYGRREPGEQYDVYCYARELRGKRCRDGWVRAGPGGWAQGTSLQGGGYGWERGQLHSHQRRA